MKKVTQKFLYLEYNDYANTWINGGSIPIKLASSYISNERQGKFTPDENTILTGSTDFRKMPNIGSFKNATFINSFYIDNNGIQEMNTLNSAYYKENGLILSFCNIFDKEIAVKLNKQACVEITNMKTLKQKIDEQLECEGIMQDCKYTNSHQRNHFLKGKEDGWQNEYRIFWNKSDNDKIEVQIPKGTAKLVANNLTQIQKTC